MKKTEEKIEDVPQLCRQIDAAREEVKRCEARLLNARGRSQSGGRSRALGAAQARLAALREELRILAKPSQKSATFRSHDLPDIGDLVAKSVEPLLLDVFAGEALQGLITAKVPTLTELKACPEWYTEAAYGLAEAMLAERKKVLARRASPPPAGGTSCPD